MILNKTKESAHGKWRGILKELGFTDKELSGDHGPCPMCEGKDRFRFTDYKGNGEYFCSGCGPGAGFDLLCGKLDWEFGHAAKQVDLIIGNGVQEVFKPKVDVEKRRRDLNSLWAKATNFDIVKEYLMTRGIGDQETGFKGLTDLRGIDQMYMAKSSATHRGMLALIRNKNGTPISIHRTYVDAKQKKIMPPTENILGASIRLGVLADDSVVIGEGIETTVAGMSVYRMPGMVALSAQGMEEIVLPSHIRRVVILADNDHSFTGQKSAFTLARRLDKQKQKISVDVIMSDAVGQDYLDYQTIAGNAELLEWSNEE